MGNQTIIHHHFPDPDPLKELFEMAYQARSRPNFFEHITVCKMGRYILPVEAPKTEEKLVK